MQKKPWGTLKHLYYPPLTEKDTEIIYNLNSSEIEKANQTVDEMQTQITRVQKQLGFEGVNFLGDRQKKEQFSEALKKDDGWISSWKNICKMFAPSIDPMEVIQSIDRPFWNNLQFGFLSDKYDSPKYQVHSEISSSLLTQLSESHFRKFRLNRLHPASISNVLTTADNQMVLGYRGGNSYYDVIMTVPAGSIEPHTKPGERKALFGSYDKEMFEELRLKPEHCESSKLIAKAEESLLASNGWDYYVFSTKTKMNFKELNEYWQTADDKKEHRHLVNYEYNPDLILKELKEKAFDISKANQDAINKTTPENIGKILPQCSVCVLADLAHNYGSSWAQQAQDYLEGHYDLTSCFKNE